MELNQPVFTSHHFSKDGLPDGSITYGVGFCIAWQRGALTNNGRNGAFLTDVLAACLDELKFKHSQYPCTENIQAISNLTSCSPLPYDYPT